MSRSPKAVGVPLHEIRLTEAILNNLGAVFRPGTGRSTVLIPEPLLPVGRPDLLVLSVSSAALTARASRGLRLETPSEARVLATAVEERSSNGVSKGRASEIRLQLRRRGWLDHAGRLAIPIRPLVGDSLVVEAKVSEWRRAMSQLARARSHCHRSAIAMPVESQSRVGRSYLKKGGIGLIAIEDDGHVKWLRRPVNSSLKLSSDLWMVELAIRHLWP